MLPIQDHIPEFAQLPALTEQELEQISAETARVLGEMLARDSLAPATVRSYASSLRYWDERHRASFGTQLPLLRTPREPVKAATVCAFIAHHAPVPDPERPKAEARGNTAAAPVTYRMAMPEPVRNRLVALGAIGKRQVHTRGKPAASGDPGGTAWPGCADSAPARKTGRKSDVSRERKAASEVHPDVPTIATVKHRVMSLSSCHKLAGLPANFLDEPTVKQALRALRNRVGNDVKPMLRQPKEPITRLMLMQMLANCADDGLRGIRDAALLHVAFDTGGRRRGELISMRWTDLKPYRDTDQAGNVRVGLVLHLQQSKGKVSERTDRGVMSLALFGATVDALKRWRSAAMAHELPPDGPVWYRVIPGKQSEGEWIPSTPMIGEDVSKIVRMRVEQLPADEFGLQRDPSRYSAHSLRGGAATTFLLEGGHLDDAANMLGHSSIETTRRYYDHRDNPADAIARHTAAHGDISEPPKRGS